MYKNIFICKDHSFLNLAYKAASKHVHFIKSDV